MNSARGSVLGERLERAAKKGDKAEMAKVQALLQADPGRAGEGEAVAGAARHAAPSTVRRASLHAILYAAEVVHPRALVAGSLLSALVACGPAGGAAPAGAPQPDPLASSPPYPRLRLRWSSPTSEEASNSATELRADGAFVRVAFASNGTPGGGSEDTCVGRVTPAEAEAWLARARAAATLATPPPRSGRTAPPEFRDADSYVVEVMTGPGAASYADPRALGGELEAMFARMRASWQCRHATRER